MVVSVLVEVSSTNVDKTYDYLVPSTLEYYDESSIQKYKACQS